MPNEEWDLKTDSGGGGSGYLEIQKKKYNCCPEIYESMHLKFTANRRSGFYFRTFELPSVMLFSAMLLSFAIPFTIGERVGFATTMALALVVFLLTLADQLPKTEETPELQRLFMGLMYSKTFIMRDDPKSEIADRKFTSNDLNSAYNTVEFCVLNVISM
jgi:hypothetical protein